MIEHCIYCSKRAFRVMNTTYNFNDFCPSNIYSECLIKGKREMYLSGRIYCMQAIVINDDICLFMPNESMSACIIRVGRVWTDGAGVVMHTETIIENLDLEEEDDNGEI